MPWLMVPNPSNTMYTANVSDLTRDFSSVGSARRRCDLADRRRKRWQHRQQAGLLRVVPVSVARALLPVVRNTSTNGS